MRRYTITNPHTGVVFRTDDEALAGHGLQFDDWFPQSEHGESPEVQIEDEETHPSFAAEVSARRARDRVERRQARVVRMLTSGITEMHASGQVIPPSWTELAELIDEAPSPDQWRTFVATRKPR